MQYFNWGDGKLRASRVVPVKYDRVVERYIPCGLGCSTRIRINALRPLKAGAVCGSAARTDLCGGRGAILVPTTTIALAQPRHRLVSPTSMTGERTAMPWS